MRRNYSTFRPQEGWTELKNPPKDCFDQCLHFDITREAIEDARAKEKAIQDDKGPNNPTTYYYRKDRDFIGALCQDGFIDYTKSIGVLMEHITPYHVPGMHGDKFDFKHRGVKVDTKGGEVHKDWPIISPGSKLWIDRGDLAKPGFDSFLFVKVNQDDWTLHIIGIISKADFEKKMEVETMEDGHEKLTIRAKDTKPVRSFIFGIADDPSR